MLTRIEIDGFKTFENFALNLEPFTVLLGANASGKSNLFDAIHLLSNLAARDVREAVKDLRGEPDELFRMVPSRSLEEHSREGLARGSDRVAEEEADFVASRPPGGGSGAEIQNTMKFAVEVLVEPRVRDQWGAEVELTHTRLRYEVTVERRVDDRGIARLIVTHEDARPILKSRDAWARQVSPDFELEYLKYRRQTPFLDSQKEGGRSGFFVHQDKRQGRVRSHPAVAAEATVLSSITSSDEFPHLFALREELRSWRLLQLDPASLRLPSPQISDELLLSNGSNLAYVLWRIKAETSDGMNPRGSVADIAAELAGLIPGVLDMDVKLDSAERKYRVDVMMRDGVQFPSRVISDGTLRILALLTILYDPRHRGLICFEEPENGVHPARLKMLMARLRNLVTNPRGAEISPGEPLSQLIMNSHSPVVLSTLGEGSAVFFADTVAVVDPHLRQVRRKSRVRQVHRHAQLGMYQDSPNEIVTRAEVQDYLGTATAEVGA